MKLAVVVGAGGVVGLSTGRGNAVEGGGFLSLFSVPGRKNREPWLTQMLQVPRMEEHTSKYSARMTQVKLRSDDQSVLLAFQSASRETGQGAPLLSVPGATRPNN